MSPVLELINYGGGNLGSVQRRLEALEVSYHTVTPDAPPSGELPVILPGVGAFGAVMERLRLNGLDERLKAMIRNGTPYLGICVGQQILFDASEESPGVAGLGLLPGTVRRFTQGKIPQIGWNRIEPQQAGWAAGFVYFVNSYVAVPTESPEDSPITLYTADYHGPFCAAVRHQNITAFQFHTEKSGEFGQDLLRQWIAGVT